jgi:hypothetical protein
MHTNIRYGIPILLLISVALMFWYASTKRTELSRDTTVTTPTTTAPSGDVEDMRINAIHFYQNGTHTLAGERLMKTPCDLLVASTTLRESLPESITLALSIVNNDTTCIQKPTVQRFRVDVKASKDANWDATINGKEALLNLRDALPGETPQKLEDLYFKG